MLCFVLKTNQQTKSNNNIKCVTIFQSYREKKHGLCPWKMYTWMSEEEVGFEY